ncbi:NACHT domain-containing protein [Actinomadura sp. KC216]|uniref:NACHT domain-containing protein n=1 Tax=Actinomadura sp. KC216 TaxID=2530370 RepID=UPI0010456668|nr:NACHT domain-containing protein [Actinomadura sp. KC216]TDB89414.1 NACHT domain-containing protein [Actinomadura sp. KC216]
MTADVPPPPDPTTAATTADFVRSLIRLKQWAGEPSLSRLRSLGGQTLASDGTTVDALPKSTISHVLRQTGKLPRWDFVQAFVTACYRYRDYPAERIPGEIERWRAARAALAGPAAPASPDPVERPAPVDATAPPERDHAVELLARRVAREEDRARKGMLGGYSLAPVSFGPSAVPGEADGDLHSIGRFFSGLRSRRLLVVGESGAGKTVLAIELVLQLLESFLTSDQRPDDRQMVPVHLNAARWILGCPFEQWLAEQLQRDFGLSENEAVRLVRDRRVLPVVDGLDELDSGPSGPPRRAIGLLTELNRYSDLSGRRPGAVVVTCRADRYTELFEARIGLDDAARIHLHDLTTDQIRAYLQARWPDGHPCGAHRDGIRAALSGPPETAVHMALSTPWRLQLLATAVESGAHPAELLDVDPDRDPREAASRIVRRLLDLYVPAATRLTPRTAPHQPEQVRKWLEHLAAHLSWQAADTKRPPGLTAVDIVPHLLWPIGGRRRVRALHCLACVVLAVIAMLAFWTGSAMDQPDDLTPSEGVTLALMAAWVAIATGLSLSPWPAAAGGRANVPRKRRVIGSLLGALVGLPLGVLGGLAGLVLTSGKVFGLLYATTAGATGGAVLGAVIGLTAAGRRDSERMAVREAVRAEPFTLLGFGLCGALTGLPPLRLAHAGPVPMALGVTGAFALAFALGVVFKITTGGWSRDAELTHPREALHRNPIIGTAFGLTGGVAAFLVFLMNQSVIESLACALVGGVTFGLAFGAIAWCRAMIGLLVAAARGLLPLQLWTFLDWACEARLLRVSGATYQFRHRELQDFLTPPKPSDDTQAHSAQQRLPAL